MGVCNRTTRSRCKEEKIANEDADVDAHATGPMHHSIVTIKSRIEKGSYFASI